MHTIAINPFKSLFLFQSVLALSCFLLRDASSRQPDADRPAPEVPWADAARRQRPPGQPKEDYTPVVTPNARVADSITVDGTRIFHLIAEPITHEVAPGLTVDVWGFNGTMPGPVLELTEGENVRIYVSNHLPARTSVHWHGVLLPCGMDGAAGLTQPPIEPGETFLYDFYFSEAGTFMYHSHVDSMTQDGMGLVGMIVVHQRLPKAKRPDRGFCHHAS